MTGDDVRSAAQVCVAALTPRLNEDWSAPVPGLDFTVSSVLAHASLGPLWYALDAWAGETDSARFTLGVAPDASPEALIAGLQQAAAVCAASLDAAPPDLRGFHPAGSPDRSGFAAMACAELLIHTDDALRGLNARDSHLHRGLDAHLAPNTLRDPDTLHSRDSHLDPDTSRGLGIHPDARRGPNTRLAPPSSLAATVLRRLFPHHEVDADPWQTLLWAHARPSTLDRPPPSEWRWHPAPLPMP
jgi:hypothetical protein